jgi:hypothetical protein
MPPELKNSTFRREFQFVLRIKAHNILEFHYPNEFNKQCCVFCEVGNELPYIIQTDLPFRKLNGISLNVVKFTLISHSFIYNNQLLFLV